MPSVLWCSRYCNTVNTSAFGDVVFGMYCSPVHTVVKAVSYKYEDRSRYCSAVGIVVPSEAQRSQCCCAVGTAVRSVL